jgi:phosphotransferase system enzyme I (PtsP)
MPSRPATTPRRLLARLRETMARGVAGLQDLVLLVAGELVSEVCSVYVIRPGDLLELAATEGLRPDAIGRTRLRVGEGIVGICAATGQVLNLPDAPNHPGFAYRPETGEEPFTSMLAVPVRRAGHTLGVLTVQNRAPRQYSDDEVEVVETVAMVLAELLAAAGVADAAEEGVGAALPRRFAAASLAPGIATGPVILLGSSHIPRRVLADDPDAELARLAGAVKAMQRGVDRLIADAVPDGAGDTREVLQAFRLFAADGGWLKRVSDAIRTGLAAEAAVHRTAGELRERMRRISDPYLRERLADLEDLVGRLLAELDGSSAVPPVAPGGILVARRLGPAELLSWHARGIAGVAIEEASSVGHAAIIARALGLPALGGMRDLIERVENGDEAILDADIGQFILRPEADVKEMYCRALSDRTAQAAEWAALRHRPAITRDDVRVRLMLNMGLAVELDQLEATGAEGIGLFRTEMSVLARGAIPDVADQAALYRRVLEAAGDRPVMFRTLDLGGDKLLPNAPQPAEQNPAMGWRSIRVGLDRPALLRRQLRALLLAAAGKSLCVMFPMVATVAEYRAARALLLAEAARSRPGPDRISIGTMLEIPALMWQLEHLLREVDFVSVGSNDLMQFLFAADRGSPALAGRYDVLSPPMLDILQRLRVRAERAGVALSICGEAASQPLVALTLAALGYTTLSMRASSILPVKAALAAADLGAFRSVLRGIRRSAAGAHSLRDPIAAWAHDQNLPL